MHAHLRIHACSHTHTCMHARTHIIFQIHNGTPSVSQSNKCFILQLSALKSTNTYAPISSQYPRSVEMPYNSMHHPLSLITPKKPCVIVKLSSTFCTCSCWLGLGFWFQPDHNHPCLNPAQHLGTGHWMPDIYWERMDLQNGWDLSNELTVLHGWDFLFTAYSVESTGLALVKYLKCT